LYRILISRLKRGRARELKPIGEDEEEEESEEEEEEEPVQGN
jgi:hypothetical protein